MFGLSVKPQDLTGKNVIVTGANTGIGLETARMLAGMHASVILACRSADKGATAVNDIRATTGNDNVECWVVDFSKFDTVRAFAKRYLDTGKPLDLLINNAGLITLKMETTADNHEMNYQVNYLSHFLLTVEIMPAIKKAQHPRIVNVSSVVHYNGVIDFDNLEPKGGDSSFSFTQVYANSKLMNVLFTVELARRLSSHASTRHIVTHSLHPGLIQSDIWNRDSHKERPFMSGLIRATTTVGSLFMRNTTQGAMTSVYVAVEPAVGDVNGLYYDSCAEKAPIKLVKNTEVTRRLWEVSAKTVGADLELA